MFWRDVWSQERPGWVEQPATYHEEHRRCGLASAALTALRQEHPGLRWHTLGGHLTGSVPFWEAATGMFLAATPGALSARTPDVAGDADH